MRAAVLSTIASPPHHADFPEPVATEGEVIVNVLAAALKPVDKQIAAGTHYASPKNLPVICGTDGVGQFPDGSRVFFGGARAPYGSMAERSVVRQAFCFPLPGGLDDVTAAAVPNPGVSAWLTLAHRARLVPGENVLILGATGVTGKLAVKIAKLLGAARVVAAGRNPQALNSLLQLGADAIIRLDAPPNELADAFAREAGNKGFQVVINYVWGKPTEIFLSAITRTEFAAITTETRLVQVGESAGPTIALPAAVLRSTPITILGTAGLPPREVLGEALQKVFAHAAAGDLRVDTETVPLTEIEQAWQRDSQGRRLVVIP
jgi:NADPH:quinone reductase-like Zn-dependent oxidoreductase